MIFKVIINNGEYNCKFKIHFPYSLNLAIEIAFQNHLGFIYLITRYLHDSITTKYRTNKIKTINMENKIIYLCIILIF